jgi:hypothetical protein
MPVIDCTAGINSPDAVNRFGTQTAFLGLKQYPCESVDVAKRRPQVVRHRIAERFQFVTRSRQLFGSLVQLADSEFQIDVQFPYLIFGPLPVRNFLFDGEAREAQKNQGQQISSSNHYFGSARANFQFSRAAIHQAIFFFLHGRGRPPNLLRGHFCSAVCFRADFRCQSVPSLNLDAPFHLNQISCQQRLKAIERFPLHGVVGGQPSRTWPTSKFNRAIQTLKFVSELSSPVITKLRSAISRWFKLAATSSRLSRTRCV